MVKPNFVAEAQRIHAELCAIYAAREELEVREIPLLQQAEALETWTVFGCVTFAEYLERVLGYKPRTAQDKVRVARALADLPDIREALTTRQLAYWRVRELTRVATPKTERAWIDMTRDMGAREFESFVAAHAKGDEPDKPSKAQTHVEVTLRVSPETAERLHRKRGQVAAELGEGSLEVTDDDVLRTVFDAHDAAGRGAGPAIRTFVATCRECRKQWQSRGGAQLPADPVTVAMSACDSEHLGDVEADVPARIRKTVSKRMRENVLARDDYRCCVPNCRSRRFLHIHHLEPKSRGGRNRISNLLTVCGGHHQQLHDGRLKVTGSAPHAVEYRWPTPREPGSRDGPAARPPEASMPAAPPN